MRSAKWSNISHWSCCNIGYHPETHHELKSREISFAPESFLTCQIVCKYYTEQCSNTVLPYSVWNIKMTGQNRNRLWAWISLDSCLRWISMCFIATVHGSRKRRLRKQQTVHTATHWYVPAAEDMKQQKRTSLLVWLPFFIWSGANTMGRSGLLFKKDIFRFPKVFWTNDQDIDIVWQCLRDEYYFTLPLKHILWIQKWIIK